MARILLVSLLVLLGAAQPKALVSGTPETFKLDSSDQLSLAFQPQNETVRLYLFIQYTATDLLGTPILQVTQDKKEFFCTVGDQNILCVIEPQFLSNSSPVNIEMRCMRNCQGNITGILSRSLPINVGQTASYTFSKDDGTFEVQIKFGNNDFSEAGIVATIDNPEDVRTSLKLYALASEEDFPTAEKYTFRGQSVWNDGEGIFLQSKDLGTSKSVRVVLYGSQGMTINFDSYSSKDNLRSISIGQTVYDDASVKSPKLYVLNITNAKTLSRDLIIKLIKYSGYINITAAPNKDFPKQLTTQGPTTQSITQIVIDQKVIRDHKYDNELWLKIEAEYESTYMITSWILDENFFILDDGVAEISSIEGDEVDNYLYIVSTSSTNSQIYRKFTIGVEVYSQDLMYGIRRCVEMELTGTNECYLKTVDEVMKASDSFKEIEGETRDGIALKYFTFEYDLSNCTKQGSTTHTCAFQIVCFNDKKSKNPASYTIMIEETKNEINLAEGVPIKRRGFEEMPDKYYFSLNDLANVQSITFILSIISGDCLLMSATDARYHSITDPEVEIGINDTITYKKDKLARQYFLQVVTYIPCYYTLTALVDRSNIEEATLLTEGISQYSFFDSEHESRIFLIKLLKKKDIIIDLIQMSGSSNFTVSTAKDGKRTEKGKQWQGSNTDHVTISAEDIQRQGKEFIITVVGDKNASFNIEYNEKGQCPSHQLGHAVTINVPGQESRCFQYEVSHIAEVELVLASSYFDMTTGNMNITIEWNGKDARQLFERVTLFSMAQVNSKCKNEGKSTTACILTVHINSLQNLNVTMVAQHTDGEIQLFDGVAQHSKGKLSFKEGRYFYYKVANKNSSILISLKSTSDTKYKLIAKLIDWKSYLNMSNTYLYPKYRGVNMWSSDTNKFGLNMLVIKPSDLKDRQPDENLLLISVVSIDLDDVDASFTIEVFQSVSKLKPSENKIGYLQKGQQQYFTINTDGKKQLIVSLNSYNVNCAKMSLYNTKDITDDTTPISKAITGDLIIPPTDNPQEYTIQVSATSVCPYQVSYTTFSNRLYELIHGQLFYAELKQNQHVYFLYYNTRNESFRVVSMADYGMVEFNGKHLPKNTSMDNLTGLIADARWEFGGPSHDRSMFVSSNDSRFCVECYYLIEMTSEAAASVGVVVHSQLSPIVMRENKVTRETLSNQTTTNITYANLEIASFKINIGLLFGKVNLKVTSTWSETVMVDRNVTEPASIFVEFNETKTNYTFLAFLVTLSCEQKCSFSLSFNGKNYPQRLVEGIPHNIEISSETEAKCVQFLSLENVKPIDLHINTAQTANIFYTVQFYNRDTWTEYTNKSIDFLRNQSKNQQSINLELKSMRGYYLVCFRLQDNIKTAQNLTILHSENINLRYVKANTENLMTTRASEEATLVEMYNPTNNSVMVEVFECKGELLFGATHDYKKFMDEFSNIAEHSKTAGHYVVRLDPNNTQESMLFARIGVKDPRRWTQSNFLFKYSFFSPQAFPYTSIGPEDTSIWYEYHEEAVHFTVNAVKHNDNYRILSYQYKIMTASDPATLKSAIQCGTLDTLSRTVNLGVNDALNLEEVSFQFPLWEIKALTSGFDSYFYVAVSCKVDVVSTQSDDPTVQTYRFIYDTVQMTQNKPTHKFASFKRIVRFVILWIVLPVVLCSWLLYMAIKYCVKGLRQVQHGQFVEEEPPAQNIPGTMTLPVGVTEEVLAGRNAAPRKPNDQV